MGIDIDIFFDHDLGNLSSQEFIAEIKQRSGKEVFLGNSPDYKIHQNAIHISFQEKNFNEAYSKTNSYLSIELINNGKRIPLNIYFFRNAIHVFTNSDFDGDVGGRWNFYIKDIYAENGAKKMREKIECMKKVLVPIFHCTRVMMCGDSFGYDLISDPIYDGKTIEETIEYAMCPYHKNSDYPKIQKILSLSDKFNPYMADGKYINEDIIINEKWENK